MKTKPNSKPRLENLIGVLILAFHFSPIICRPQRHGHHSSASPPSGSPHSYDLIRADAMAKFGEETNPHKNTSAPLDDLIDLRAVSLNRFDYNARPIDGDSNDSHLSRVGDEYVSVGGTSVVGVMLANRAIQRDVTYGFEEDVGTTHDDVYYHASDGFEEGERSFQEYVDTTVHLAHADVNEVVSFPPSRNSDRKRRRQRSSPNRWRRRHKLLSKTRDSKDHSSGPQRRRDRFLLKSDGPGHVIFKAGEVKKDWCRTIPFEQNVTAGRCSKTVKNNLCYGQCNSFFIPQSEKGSSKVAFQSFSFCKPHRLRWVNVTLDCPPGRHSTKVVQKTILKVESCRCIAADANEIDKNSEYLRKGAKNVRVNQ